MSAILLVALTSFAGLEGRIREGETFETTESRTKELVRLKLAKEAAKTADKVAADAPAPAPEKEEKEPRKTKEDKTDLKTK